MMKAVATSTTIRSASYWAELKPADHLVQCWTHEDSLLSALEGFMSAGLRCGEAVVVICTASHLHEVEKRLRSHWLDIDRARWEGRYVPLLAQETLSQLIGDDGLPDEMRFRAIMNKVLERARAKERGARAFGEMVNLLWAAGNKEGTIRLEQLWTAFIREHRMPLFCAYDRMLFVDRGESMKSICGLHTTVLPG